MTTLTEQYEQGFELAQLGADDFEHRLVYKYIIDRIKGEKL